jgi:hypothetical protein
MRILVIAPDHVDLPNASAEIATIDRHHDATFLRGIVRDVDIPPALEDGAFDIIWWITHGNPQGVLLSDGILSIAGVGQYQRRSGAKLGVLNSCESEEIARAVIVGGVADMICTVTPVANKEAVRIGTLLAAELARTPDYYAAYEVVDPDNGTYKYLRAKVQRIVPSANRGRLMPEVEIELRGNITTLTKTVYDFNRALSDSLTKLEATVSLNSRMTEQQIVAMREQITATRQQSDRQLAAIEQQTELMRVRFADVDGLKIQASPSTPVRVAPWWQPYLTPVLLTIIFITFLWWLSFGGG